MTDWKQPPPAMPMDEDSLIVRGIVPEPTREVYDAWDLIRNKQVQKAYELIMDSGFAVEKPVELDVIEKFQRKNRLSSKADEQVEKWDIRDLAEQRRKERDAAERVKNYAPAVQSLDDMLEDEEPPTDWVIPGLLGRQDRVIVTGLEGSGKSMLSRQMAMCAASGVHPFDLCMSNYAPRRVLVVDLENPTELVRISLRTLRTVAGKRYQKGAFHVVSRPEGMDLVGNDGAELRMELDKIEGGIDLLVIGPLYKMVTEGDISEEPTARELTATLDRIRIEYGFALWIEAHAPHQGDENKKPTVTRPYGASLFKRWPEFGLFLHYDAEYGVGEMWRWRKDRWADRKWPTQLRRGGEWPWTHPEAESDKEWYPVQAAAEKYAAENRGDVPSVRKLGDRIGMSKSAADRLIKNHAERWEALKVSLREAYGPKPAIHEGQGEIELTSSDDSE